MSLYDRGPFPRDSLTDLSTKPTEFDHYAHLENLVGEESRLLEEAEETRKHEHHERLHEIAHELDHAWDLLRARADRLGRHEASPSDES